MCGIAGISMSHNDQKMNAANAAESLLTGIASRGPDATGAAWYNVDDDTVSLTKIAVPAWRFIEARKDVLPDETPTMLLHTRFGTHGAASVRSNNHPVVHGNIIGIHNGVLSNHKELFQSMKREPLTEVDSEAIMALLNTDKHPTEVLGQIRGDAAVAWINLQEPEVLHLANVIGRPLHIAQTTEGSLLFASTKKTLDDTAQDNGLEIEFYQDVPGAKYLRVEYGVITQYLDIENVQEHDEAFSKAYAWTSGTQSVAKTPAKKHQQSKAQKAVTTTKKTTTKKPDADKAKALPFSDQPRPLKERSHADLVKMEVSGSRAATDELNARLYDRFYQEKSLDELEKLSQAGYQMAEQALKARKEELMKAKKAVAVQV